MRAGRAPLCVGLLIVIGALETTALRAQVPAITPETSPSVHRALHGAVPANPATRGAAALSDWASPPPGASAPFGGCQTSPFAAPDLMKEDTVFALDCGGGLDTGCTFRGGGPLIIQVPITRYVGQTNGDGTLAFPFTMNANKLISLNAKVRLPAFDVDYDAVVPDVAPERDRISINGHQLGFLTGSNNIWKLNEFTIPITYLKFPSAPGGAGGAPTPAMNEIRIDIDTMNSDEVWCTAIDWVSIKIDAMAPLMLVHGVHSDHETWEPGVANYLTNRMVIHSNAIAPVDNPPDSTVIGNGRVLAPKAAAFAAQVGAKKVHMVCHSKGGLDTRAFLGFFYNPDQVKVLSQHTLSTPHHGSILATISVARLSYNDPTSDDDYVLKYMRQDWLGGVLGQAPEQPALGNLSQAYMAAFNGFNTLPGGVRYHSYSADADVNNDTLISNGEAAGMIPGAVNGAILTGTLLYRLLRYVDGITVTRFTNFWGLNEWHVINPVPAAFAHDNDLAVTQQSAQHPRFTYHPQYDLNHSTIKGTGPIQDVLDQIQADYPVNNTPN